MIAALLILIASSLLTLAVGWFRAYAPFARLVAVLGTGAALVVAVYSEGLQGGGATGTTIDWPPLLEWIGQPLYRSDVLSAGLGAWCLLLGLLCLISDQWAGERTSEKLAAGALIIATLYSLAHTWDLVAFDAQLLLLLPLTWVLNSQLTTNNQQPTTRNSQLTTPHSPLALGVGASCVLGAALIIGRTTGGQHALSDLTLSTLTPWPLALIAIGAALWLGLAPVTGWSARGYTGPQAALVQSLVIGVPIVTLILRLQGLVTAQGLAGSTPEGWSAFTGALAWAGALTAIAAGAGTIVAAGTPNWSSLLTAHTLGLVTWALGLDTPLGRYSAIAILAAFGAARVTLELSSTRIIPAFALAAAPLTAGFVGVWLLGNALVQAGRPSLAIVLVGAAILSACGTALHFGLEGLRFEGSKVVDSRASGSRYPALAARYSALLGGAALIVGGVAPNLWLPQVADIASVAGGNAQVNLPWTGPAIGSNLLFPTVLLGLAALSLVVIGWLLTAWMRSGATPGGVLLSTALERGSQVQKLEGSKVEIQNPSVPTPVWWLSLAWLDAALWGFGALIMRLGTRVGLGLGRLEGRYYLPLALVLVLIALLVVTR